jgi:predicted enzyme related to lactoylglutathione lyase
VPTIRNVTFACEEPVRLAEFWQAALGYVPPEIPPEVTSEIDAAIERGELDAGGWAMLVPPDGAGPRLLFQRRPKTPVESIPIHLDLAVDDREAEVQRLTSLGATVVETKSHTIGPFEEVWTVMKDPEGNGFCVQ